MQGSFKVISTPEQDDQTIQGSFRVVSEGKPTKDQQKSIDAWNARLRANHQFSDVGLTFTPDYDRLAKEKARESGYSIPENPVNRSGAFGINQMQGALLQFGDELAGVSASVPEVLKNAPKLAYNAPGALMGKSDSIKSVADAMGDIGPAYRDTTDDFRLREDMADAYRRGTSIAGEVGGGLTIPLVGGMKTLATGTYAAGKPLLNLATTTLGGGALGGFFGGAYGAGQADEGDRVQLAKNYGTFGAAAGAVMSPGVRYVVAPFLGAVGRKMFSSSEDKAVDIILKRAERAGVSLDDVRAQFEAWNKTGDVPETLAELMGPQEKQLLSALITVNRETRETAADVFTKRNRGEAQRLKDGLEGSTGVRGDQFHDEAVRLRQERATAAKPLYEAAHYADDGSLRTLGDDSVTSLYALFRNSETAQRTLERAASEADLLGMPHIRDEIRRFATGLGQGQRPRSMTVQAADYIERNLNDLVRGATKGDSTATNLGTVGALRGFRDQVRSIIDDTGLGAARQRSADAIRAEELLEAGRDALKRGTDIEDVRANLGGDPTRDVPAATDAGRRAYMMGAVRGVSDDLDNQVDMGGFANQARALARTPAVRAKINEIKPKRLTKSGAEDQRFAQTRANAAFDETIDRVANRSQTSVDMVGNSATAFRQGAVDDVMLDFGAGQAAGDAVKDAMTNGPWQALTNRVGRAVGAGVDRVFRPGIYNDRINRAAADILLSSGDQIPKQINALAQRAQKRGFNVGGPPPNAPLVAPMQNAMATKPPAKKPMPQTQFNAMIDPMQAVRTIGTNLDVGGGTAGALYGWNAPYFNVDGKEGFSMEDKLVNSLFFGAGGFMAGAGLERGGGAAMNALRKSQKFKPGDIPTYQQWEKKTYGGPVEREEPHAPLSKSLGFEVPKHARRTARANVRDERRERRELYKSKLPPEEQMTAHERAMAKQELQRLKTEGYEETATGTMVRKSDRTDYDHDNPLYRVATKERGDAPEGQEYLQWDEGFAKLPGLSMPITGVRPPNEKRLASKGWVWLSDDPTTAARLAGEHQRPYRPVISESSPVQDDMLTLVPKRGGRGDLRLKGNESKPEIEAKVQKLFDGGATTVRLTIPQQRTSTNVVVPEYSVIIARQSDLRSPRAAFDPRKSGTPGIMNAVPVLGPPGAGALAYEQTANPK